MLNRRGLFGFFAGAAVAAPAAAKALGEVAYASGGFAREAGPFQIGDVIRPEYPDVMVPEIKIVCTNPENWALDIGPDGIIRGMVRLDSADGLRLAIAHKENHHV